MNAELFPDAEQIRAHWNAITRPGDVREVRVLEHVPANGYGQPSTASGYFDNPDDLVREIQGIGSQHASGVYISQNPVDPELRARANNRLRRKAKHTTADSDVARYTHITIDCDPARKAGISATDAELARALARRDAVVEFLTDELDWPAPCVRMMSGNGGHATWCIELPTDEAGRALVEGALHAGAALFGDDDVSIDTTLSNPSRIIKLAGTVSGKGDSLPHRPHRVAHSTFNPDAGVVAEAQLRALVALMPEPETVRKAGRTIRAGGGVGTGETHDVPELLRVAGVSFTEHRRGDMVAYRLDCCLSSDAHTDGAAILQFSSGAVAYRCHHNTCAGVGWRDVKPRLGLAESPAGEAAERQERARGESDPSPVGARLQVRALSTVIARPTNWLWNRHLARGKFHLFGGLAGDGKSTIAAEFAAIGSIGGRWPDGDRSPRVRSLFMLGEDALDDTLRPRLDIHGADVSQILAIETVLDGEGRERFFNIEKHLDLLEASISENHIDVIWIDPLTTIMSGRDRNAEGDTRDSLTPLIKLAERCNVAVVGIAHVGKPGVGQRTAMQRILGATAFHALARVIWMTAPADDGKMAFGVVKSNLAMKPDPLLWSREEDHPIAWHGVSGRTIEDLMQGAALKAPRADAEGWLRELLAGGSRLSADVEQQARAEGLAWATVRRAADLIGVERFKEGGSFNGRWFWKLPNGDPREGAHHGASEQLRDSPKLLTPEDTRVSNFATSKVLNGNTGEHLHETTPILGVHEVAHPNSEVAQSAEVAHMSIFRGEQLRCVDCGVALPADATGFYCARHGGSSASASNGVEDLRKAGLPPLTPAAAEMLAKLQSAPAAELSELDDYRRELSAAPADDPTADDERLALAHFDAMQATGRVAS